MKKILFIFALSTILTGCSDELVIEPVCSVNQTLVDNVCVDIEDDPICSANQTLVDNVCVNIEDDPTCSVNQELVDNVCVDIVDEVLECEVNQELINDECVDKVDYTIEAPDDFIINVVNSSITSATMERYFHVEFTDIEYKPFLNELCITFEMDDIEHRNATYYMMLQSETSILTLQQLAFTIGSSTTTHGGCFNAMSKEITYNILIGKVDDDDLNPTDYIEAVASISFKDPNFNERARLESKLLTFDNQIEYTIDELPFINYEITFEDNGVAIEEVKVNLYELDFGSFIEGRTITITEAERNESGVFLPNILFDSLAPNVDYCIVVFISGNDGFDSFDNLRVGRDDFTSGCFNWPCGTSYTDLFAGITSVELTDTEAIINYIALNNGEIVSSGDNEPYEMILSVKDKQGTLKYSILLDSDLTSIRIPIEYVEYWDTIEISSDKDNIHFSTFEIAVDPPAIDISAISNGSFSVNVISGLEDINFISFDFANQIEGMSLTNAEIDIPKSVNTVHITNYSNISGYTEIYVFYNISYETLDGTKLEQGWILVDINS